ncbi:unnamed protein product [Triticum turgidum subsp. durum]|uniref:Protein kinase domain-containing protein n=1 Tax=Triticum turgidum subsp. durum TaxID=4567 RepID=A0A9R1AVP3_TRITD|nr:unnamed protein product [Triticum turgidum subsp. durum]
MRGDFFSGGIPAAYRSLTKLRFLGLSGNNIGGKIPPELGELESLESLIIGYNELEGPIPPELGNLANLQDLDLAIGNLDGPIPPEIGRLPALTSLFLYKNSLEGRIPPELGNASSLVFLDLSDNLLTGPIPAEVARLSNLQLLNLMCNHLDGAVPAAIGEMKKLEVLELWNNSLTGTLPASLGRSSPLQWVDVSSNALTGEIPAGICDGKALAKLIMFSNGFSGEIPAGLASCASLVRLRAQGNRLNGTIPAGFGKLPLLQRLELAGNELSGEIPGALASSASLSFIDVSRNRLQGSLPSSLFAIPGLQSFMAAGNMISGELPDQFQDCLALGALDLSGNRLLGKIPSSLASCARLVNLNLRHNGLTGEIPPALAKMPALAILDLSSNFLTGGIPDNFGEYESGVWPWRLTAFQRLGFTCADVLACVKEANVVGMGATGVVYKAELPRARTVIAVKKLWRPAATDGDAVCNLTDDVLKEVGLLGRLRHRNIVRLLGYMHNDADAMMLYEFMPNGSLWEALHGGAPESRTMLTDWVSRYDVAAGVAQGLAYLHHDCHPPVLHRDIKSNNILLDADMQARVADFGLARALGRSGESVSVVAGSYGYIAPEYGYTLKVDQKSDIYSYGVVLMELITGRRPVETAAFGEGQDVVGWVREKIRSNTVEEHLDPLVGGGCAHVREEMLLVLRIAVLCTAKLPRDRPSMRDVLTMLGEAKPRRKSGSSAAAGNVAAVAVATPVVDKDKPVFSTTPDSV